MPAGSKPQKSKSLKSYERTNVLFLLFFVAGLAVFVGLVFEAYRSSGRLFSLGSPEDPGILSETITPEDDTCVYQLGTIVTATPHVYRSRLDIPVTDDGLARGLFEIGGIVEVVVDHKMILLRKTPSAGWETILSPAKAVINTHLHYHPY